MGCQTWSIRRLIDWKSTKEYKSMLVDTFHEHHDFGLFAVVYHLPNQIRESIPRQFLRFVLSKFLQ